MADEEKVTEAEEAPKEPKKKKFYRYTGRGFLQGLPMRNMNAGEWRLLGKEIKKALLNQGIFEEVTK